VSNSFVVKSTKEPPPPSPPKKMIIIKFEKGDYEEKESEIKIQTKQATTRG